MTDLIVHAIYYLISCFTKIIPVLDFEPQVYENISTSIGVIKELLVNVNFMIPLPDIVMIMSLVIGFRVLKFGIFVGNWLIRRICDLIPA